MCYECPASPRRTRYREYDLGMTASKPLDGLKILVVEDEFLVAMNLGNMIQTLGGEVLGPVGTVSAAIELLEKRKCMGGIGFRTRWGEQRIACTASACYRCS